MTTRPDTSALLRRRRRRNGADDPFVKATFQLSTSVVEAIRMAVKSGDAQSASGFVEDAVRDRLREIRRAQLREEYRRAAADPEFMAEMDRITAEFDPTLRDGLED